MQEEKITYENQIKKLDNELLENNLQLKIENDKLVKLQEENKRLLQKEKVKFIMSKPLPQNWFEHFVGRENCIWKQNKAVRSWEKIWAEDGIWQSC